MISELRGLSDDELSNIIKNAELIISERDKQRKKEAITQIRSIAEDAGLKVDFAEKAVTKTKNPPKYRNPDKPSQTWTGIGVKPKWFLEALTSGKKEEELLIT